MTMTVPPFVKVEHDATERRAVVTVEDKEIKQQREMWGVLMWARNL
jgi:large subunit ribosomal protein L6